MNGGGNVSGILLMEEQPMRQVTLALIAAVFSTSLGRAELFDYCYTCDAFPEAEAWWRRTHDPDQQLLRGIEQGIFWLDTRASLSIYDYYKFEDAALEPGPGESLHITWRMRTLETAPADHPSDVELGFRNSAGRHLSFSLAREYVYEQGVGPPGAPEHAYPIEPGGFHTYCFVTSDVERYELYVDGEFAFQGTFGAGVPTPVSYVFFGDVWRGVWSLSEWDSVHIQVVPEPPVGVLTLLGVLLIVSKHRTE